VVGAKKNDDLGDNSGSAYIFRDTSPLGDWGSYSVTKLLPSDGQEGDTAFGLAVDVEGATVVVGAPAYGSGAAYIYQDTSPGGDWSSYTETKLDYPGSTPSPRFARSLDLNGSSLIIGASFDNTQATRAGAAYVFQDYSPGNDWSTVTETQLLQPNGGMNDQFGYDVAIEDSIAIVSSLHRDIVFICIDNSLTGDWSEMRVEEIPGHDDFESFGRSLSLDYPAFVVGGGIGEVEAGEAYLYQSCFPAADVSIEKTADTQDAVVGQDITFTLTVQNPGPDTASNVIVSDALPGLLAYVFCSTTQGACSEAGGTVTALLGDLPPGESAAVTIVATVLDAGTAVNEATVVSDTDDPDASNNTASVTLTSSVYDLIFFDDYGRSYACVNSLSGDWSWTDLSSIGGAQTFTGAGRIHWNSGILWISSIPGEPWHMMIRNYDRYHLAFGHFIYPAYRVRSSLFDGNTQNNPDICE